MKALSIHQPWAWLIVNGYKDIENRSWRTNYRGPVLIHASSRKPTKAEVFEARKILLQSHGLSAAASMPSAAHFKLGGVIGVASITGWCVEDQMSPWFTGPIGLKLAKARPLPFKSMKGQLSFFETHQRPHRVFSLLVSEGHRDATEDELEAREREEEAAYLGMPDRNSGARGNENGQAS